MRLRIFPTVAEALHFGAGRMETIMRVAWLPVVGLLLVNMTTSFAHLSLAAGKLVTFGDLVPNLAALESYAAQAERINWAQRPQAAMIVAGAGLLAQIVLIASFMAPLIRFAGLGERPAPGVVRAPFGADQARLVLGFAASALAVGVLVLAPMHFTTTYTVEYVSTAFGRVFANFPDNDSLHTIELVQGRDLITAAGRQWVYLIGAPLLAAAPFFLVLWAVFAFHFRNAVGAHGAGGVFGLALLALALAGGLSGLAFFYIQALQSGRADALPVGFSVLFAVFAVLVYYVQLRIAAYPGIAVCRHSMAPAGTLSVTRGGDLFRLLIVFAFIGAALFAVQYIINQYALRWISSVVGATLSTTVAYSRLVSAGEEAAWIQPTFVTGWAVIRILVNIFWTFFSYGVIAGLLGRLYRLSEVSR
ncbi:MAG: hypothetical protein AAGC56_12270 [Pseudomonadota bacterium]